MGWFSDLFFHPNYGGDANNEPTPEGERDINGSIAGFGLWSDGTRPENKPAKKEPELFSRDHPKTEQQIREEYQKHAEETYQYMASAAEHFRDAMNQWEHIEAVDAEYWDTPNKPNSVTVQRGRHLPPVDYGE